MQPMPTCHTPLSQLIAVLEANCQLKRHHTEVPMHACSPTRHLFPRPTRSPCHLPLRLTLISPHHVHQPLQRQVRSVDPLHDYAPLSALRQWAGRVGKGLRARQYQGRCDALDPYPMMHSWQMPSSPFGAQHVVVHPSALHLQHETTEMIRPTPPFPRYLCLPPPPRQVRPLPPLHHQVLPLSLTRQSSFNPCHLHYSHLLNSNSPTHPSSMHMQVHNWLREWRRNNTHSHTRAHNHNRSHLLHHHQPARRGSVSTNRHQTMRGVGRLKHSMRPRHPRRTPLHLLRAAYRSGLFAQPDYLRKQT